jgi:hypothetical protein
MNTLSRLAFVAVSVFSAWALPARAQDGRVTTGIVEAVSLENGTMTVRTDQTQRPMIFSGIGSAMLVNGRGGTPTLGDLKAGIPVTVRYAVRNKQWYVEKIVYGDEAAVPAATGTATGGAAAGSAGGATTPATVVPSIPVERSTNAAPVVPNGRNN